MTEASTGPQEGSVDGVDGDDVEAIQQDDSLTAADRVDLIANQVVAEEESDGPGQNNRS
ncbi:MAG: hypothetical protein JWO93_813 [Micrococcaceae bacterium]|jgi:hypothetical protein|nr:hypothetical protein [Micrococcaceae bacterium]